jgi:hypothetical protein
LLLLVPAGVPEQLYQQLCNPHSLLSTVYVATFKGLDKLTRNSGVDMEIDLAKHYVRSLHRSLNSR